MSRRAAIEPVLPVTEPIPDVLAPRFRLEPYALYERLRRDSPIHWSDSAGCWLVTRHEHVRRLLPHPALRSRDKSAALADMEPTLRAAILPVESFLNTWMAFSDPPLHELRRLPVRHLFTPAATRAAEDEPMALAEEVSSSLGSGVHDLLADFARPFAVRATCGLLGVGVDERDRVLGWSDDLMAYLVAPGFLPEAAERAYAAIEGLRSYLEETLLPRGQGDLARVMATLAGSGALRPDEVVGLFAQILTGGIEPVSTAIVVAAVQTMQSAELMDSLRSGHLDTAALVGEALRYDTPFHFASRVAGEPIELDGRAIAAGDAVKLVIASANRDEEVFPGASRFDPWRPEGFGAALTFSRGIHHCLGHAAARVQIEAALRVLTNRRNPPRSAGPAVRQPTFGSTAFASVPVHL